jgi:hypothetical protein
VGCALPVDPIPQWSASIDEQRTAGHALLDRTLAEIADVDAEGGVCVGNPALELTDTFMWSDLSSSARGQRRPRHDAMSVELPVGGEIAEARMPLPRWPPSCAS